MRRIYLLLLFCILITGARGQTTYRYWLDNNESTQQAISGTGELQFNIDVSGLARERVHTLHVQAFSGDGVCSSPLTHFFYLPAETSVSITARYWFDNNEATQQTITKIGEQLFSIDVSGLARERIHTLHVQAFSGDGVCSSPLTHFFYLPAETSVSTTARYWFDNNEATQQFTKTVSGIIDLEVTKLSAGLHTVHYQSFGQDGKPSSVVTNRFYIEDTNNERLTCSIWFDDDEEHAVTKAVVADGINLDVSSLSIGVHEIHVALFDEYGVYVGTESAEIEIPIPTETITIGADGEGTYCSEFDLDFSEVIGLKAYIASGFIRQTGTVILMRVTDVPAFEGLVVKGEPGTYKVPHAESSAYYANMLKGNIEATMINSIEDEYTNYYLTNNINGLGFYKVDDAIAMEAHSAYMQLPTVFVNEARSLRLVFTEEEQDVLRGDANGDGEIGMPDVMFVVNYILGNPADTFNAKAADANLDGEIGMPDVMFIVNYILNGKFPNE